MKNFVLAPDSFKGTMCAQEVCGIIKAALLRHIPNAHVSSVPMADGGEGMVDAWLAACGGRRVQATVSGPLGAPVQAEYAILPNGAAVLEMAACAGLPLAWPGKDVRERDPMRTTTRGVGELLLHAAQNGAREAVLGLGGSATNEGGIGMAAALGYRFLNASGSEVPPTGAGLLDIVRIEKPQSLPGIAVSAACDGDNPLCGEGGASAVFGPQKGATPAQVAALDAGLANLAALIQRDLGPAVADVPGAGAAGGLGAGVLAFLGGRLRSGIEMLLDAAGFDSLLEDADMVFTGEGRLDGQSAAGKVPVGVARRAKKHGLPCIALCGCFGPGAARLYQHGVTAAFASLRDSAPDFETMRAGAKADMAALADNVARLLAALPSGG